MTDAADIDAQQDRALAELLELGLAAARAVQGRLLVAEDAKANAELSLALNRLSRSVRQTLALQTKVRRDRRRLDRDEAAETAKADAAQATRRKAQVRAAVERAIWTEAEDAEAERLIDEADDLVSEEMLYAGFTAEPIAAHIARICEAIGVAVPRPPPQGVGAGGEPGGLTAGGTDREAVEGAMATDSQPPALSRPPQSLRDSSPRRGAEAEDDWRSSA